MQEFQQRPAVAQPAPPNRTSLTAACREEGYAYSFSQWQRLYVMDSFANPEDVAQILKLIQRAQGDPRLSQVAIDRLTPISNLESPSRLLELIDNTPSTQQAQVLPLVEQFVVLARALPPGYNYAQSRALIAAAQAYSQLDQPSRSAPLLQQARQTLGGIAIPLLKAEVQWRWGQAWADLGQPQQQSASLAAISTILKTPSRTTTPEQDQRLSQILELFVQRQQIPQAEAIARAIPALPQRIQEQFRVATAYLRAKQVKPALALFNQTVALLRQNSRPASSELGAISTQGIIQFVQAGGVTTATQAMMQLPNLTALQRAQTWLAIAGEARQQKRPKEAAPALAQLIAAGREGQQQKFNNPYGFNGLGQNQWGHSLYRLSQSEGYQLELNQLIQQLQIQSEAAEFLIAMAVQAQQFDQAQQLIPSPLNVRNEAGTFDVQEMWRLWVAVAAAEAGKPQQLIALGEQANRKLKTEDAQVITFSAPNEFGSRSIRRDPPFVEVIDFSIASQQPVETVFVAIQVLQQQGQSAAAQSLTQVLAEHLTMMAEQLLTPGSKVQLAYNQSPLAWIGNVEQFLRFYDQAKSADRLSALQVTYLQQITDPALRAQEMAKQFFLNTSAPDLAAEISRFGTQAQALGIANQPSIAQRIVAAAIVTGQPELAADWEAQAELSAQAQADLWFQRSYSLAKGTDSSTLFSVLDKALRLYQQAPTTKPLDNVRAQQWIDIYLRFGNVEKARQIIDLMSDTEMARQWTIRLNCLDM
ncbi:hypothetical protein [Alkalinema sp. FACHB-956]|uniref:hypothetical protein n=1 Tax=Alkalinema sp. FACHB-956 TaxID=2692768 RepID=UPI0016852531|nr:hypothetical protein [Alkalinema sp. FACHB-956]MBD2327962.1 hypothetical protein [Alkalinema sp. FACHB-956]